MLMSTLLKWIPNKVNNKLTKRKYVAFDIIIINTDDQVYVSCDGCNDELCLDSLCICVLTIIITSSSDTFTNHSWSSHWEILKSLQGPGAFIVEYI